MQILTPTHSDQLPSALHDPGGNLLRPAQLTEHVNDINIAKAQLANPNVQDKGAVRKRMAELNKRYEAQAPRPITDGALKDRLKKESDQLLADILPGMLSHEEMRKNPAGSVDKHMRWERANKPKIIQWKKNQCVLNADNSDPHTWDRDAANLERFRPQGPQDRLRTDAQIGGHMTYGRVPDENWAQTFGKTHPENSALNQAKRVEQEQQEETLDSILAQAQKPIDVEMVGLDEYLPPIAEPPRKLGRKPLSDDEKKALTARFAKGRADKKLKLQTKGV